MKKLALMTAVAAIAVSPALANTKYSDTAAAVGTPPGHTYTVIDKDMKNDTVRYTTTTTNFKKQLTPDGEVDFTGQYALNDGRFLNVNGEAAKIATSTTGNGFYAPTGAYVTTKGETFYTENGKILRMENPPEVVYVDTDDITGVDVNTTAKPAAKTGKY